MIELKAVTKIYRGKRKTRTVALSGVSFTLPEQGMVFIVGKSGCGKSTLLNVIGGGDRMTSGEIVIDGNPMSAFTAREYDDYRNGAVGLVFQDYCLLDGLTVKENVALALQLAGERGGEAVLGALKKVGLEDKAKSYPFELSGGQKQRVAIARVLVKNPKYILADEPTGNLDSASSRTVLELLKELSKTRLVLIVSHNRADADEFADRIIELSDGRILGDRTHDEAAKELAFEKGQIIFQRGHNFTEEELSEANRRLERGGSLRQIDTRFCETPQCRAEEERRPFAHKKVSRQGVYALFRLFSKKRAVGMALSALCIAVLFMVLGVCQFFTQFDARAETARIMEEHSGTVFAMRKGYLAEDDPTQTLDTSHLLRVTEEDIAAFREAGYRGNIFPLYGVSMLSNEKEDKLGSLQYYLYPPDSQNYGKFYCRTGLGVLQVTEEYLIQRYGKEGKLNVLSGDIPREGDELIVTDYFADSIYAFDSGRRPSPSELAASGDKYFKITNGEMYNGRYRIAAVIETGYAERYAPLLAGLEQGEKLSELDSELALKFYEELSEGLNLAYTVAPDFAKAYNEDDDRYFAYFGEGILETEGKTLPLSTELVYRDTKLQDNEIRIRKDVYASAVGEREEDIDWGKVAGKKLKLTLGCLHEAPYLEREYVIKEAHDSSGSYFYVSPEQLKELLPHAVYPYALYFDDMESAMEVYETGTELGYYVQSPLFSAMYTVSRYASVFIDFFDIIIWTLYALVALTLLGFAAGSVRKCMYEIGVVRAMGAKISTLVLLFILQMVLVSAAVCLFAGPGLVFGAGLCNSVLAEGFVAVTKNAAMRGIRFIRFSAPTVLMDAGVIFGLTALCAVVPLLLLRRIKPHEIIRAKE